MTRVIASGGAEVIAAGACPWLRVGIELAPARGVGVAPGVDWLRTGVGVEFPSVGSGAGEATVGEGSWVGVAVWEGSGEAANGSRGAVVDAGSEVGTVAPGLSGPGPASEHAARVMKATMAISKVNLFPWLPFKLALPVLGSVK